MRFIMRFLIPAFFTLMPCVYAASAQSRTTTMSERDAGGRTEQVAVDVRAPGFPFPHFWEQMFGSGQALLSLREGYRTDLRKVKDVTEFRYVRFHDIFGDQVGVYNLGPDGKPYYNYSYVDQIYDGLLAAGIRPYVELSFMPQQLAAKESRKSVWYVPNNAPPKNYANWDDMVEQFVRHLVNRYGINELSQWYFEVWNEPDYAFPEEFPKEETYFMLYDHTARDVKRVDSRLRVGGPATANAIWITAFLDHCQQQRVPVDFVSTHMYGDENGQIVLHTKSDVPRNRMVCAAVEKVHKEIEGSTEPKLPFILSEFNASWMNIPDVLDTVYMGPWLADTIRQCDGMVDQMSFWSFSDVFEEEGVVKKPFYGGFGLIAEDSIPKPAFNAFALLHKLGDTRLISNSESSLVTRRKDGTIVIALWNFVPAETDHPTVVESKTFEVELQNVPSDAKAYVSRLDADNGNVLKAFDAMGKPSFPTQEQIKALQVAAQLPPAQAMKIERGGVRIDIPARGLALLEIHSKGGEE